MIISDCSLISVAKFAINFYPGAVDEHSTMAISLFDEMNKGGCWRKEVRWFRLNAIANQPLLNNSGCEKNQKPLLSTVVISDYFKSQTPRLNLLSFISSV